MKSAASHGEQKYNCSPDGLYTGNGLSSRVSKTPPADATCAGDQVQPFPPVARAFSLSALRQKPLQHPANVSAHLPIARALRSFAVAHHPDPLSTAAVIAAGRASVIFNPNENV